LLSTDSAEIGSVRWERLIEHVHSLGPRPLGELLAEAEVALIDNHDTVDALRRDRRQGPEFVSP